MIDHLLWAVPELEEGRRQLTRATGVASVPGGRHPGFGTHNALLGLDGERYLEILAPDPGQDRFAGLGRMLAGLSEARLLTWCARSHDLRETRRQARRAGLSPGKITPMSRLRTDGQTLHWQLLFLEDPSWGPLMPFFIDWGNSPHPSRDLDPGCRLTGLTLRHPRGPELAVTLAGLGLDRGTGVHCETAAAPEIRAALDTPAGPLELAGPATAPGEGA